MGNYGHTCPPPIHCGCAHHPLRSPTFGTRDLGPACVISRVLCSGACAAMWWRACAWHRTACASSKHSVPCPTTALHAPTLPPQALEAAFGAVNAQQCSGGMAHLARCLRASGRRQEAQSRAHGAVHMVIVWVMMRVPAHCVVHAAVCGSWRGRQPPQPQLQWAGMAFVVFCHVMPDCSPAGHATHAMGHGWCELAPHMAAHAPVRRPWHKPGRSPEALPKAWEARCPRCMRFKQYRRRVCRGSSFRVHGLEHGPRS